MKNLIFILLGVAMLTSCGLFKNTTSDKLSTKIEASEKAHSESYELHQLQEAILSVKDQVGNTLMEVSLTGNVVMHPDGKLTADSARAAVTKTDKIQEVAIQNRFQTDLGLYKKDSSIQKTESLNEVQKKSTPSNKLFIYGGIILLIFITLGFIWFKYFK